MNIKLLSSFCLMVVYMPIYSVNTRETSVKITVEEAWVLAKDNNLQLKARAKEVEIAKALLGQERLFDNPEVSISHNVNNPITHKYFDVGRDGETDIQVLQRIYIAGQRSSRINRAREDLRRSEAEFDDAMRVSRSDLRKQMITLHGLMQKTGIVDKEIISTERILGAFEKQRSLGNVAEIDIVRLRSEYLQLKRERNELDIIINDMTKALILVLGLTNDCRIIPVINYDASVSLLSNTNETEIRNRIINRPDMIANRHSIMSAKYDLKTQKANAWPELGITGEWDKNGNVGHNFFALGVSMTIPIFNRNQGSIKASQRMLETKQIDYEWQKNQVTSLALAAWQSLCIRLDLAKEVENILVGESDNLMKQIECQYIMHNVSLLELLDFYQAYKNDHYMVIDSRCEVLLAMADLDWDIK